MAKHGLAETDFRVAADFIDHFKTKKLITRLGVDGVLCLLRLWGWASINRPKGNLKGMQDEDIAIVAGFTQGESAIEELVELGWLDGEKSFRKIHDWRSHQPWIVDREKRQKASRIANKAKQDKRLGRHRTGDRTGNRIGDRTGDRSGDPPSPPPTMGGGTPAPVEGRGSSPSPNRRLREVLSEFEFPTRDLNRIVMTSAPDDVLDAVKVGLAELHAGESRAAARLAVEELLAARAKGREVSP